MVSRRRLLAIVIVAVFALSFFFYVYEAPTRGVPVLMMSISVEAEVPEGLEATGDFGPHCGARVNSLGEIQARFPPPIDAVAAVYLQVVSFPDRVGSLGHEPWLLFITVGWVSYAGRMEPFPEVFTIEFREGAFLIPPGVTLTPGDRGTRTVAYTSMENGTSIDVVETYEFRHLGHTRIRFPLAPAACL